MSTEGVPRLDLAPKRAKPLSLWNPLDYLVLLYWCFFFPQALRWYEERFGDRTYLWPGKRIQILEGIKSDPIRRNLVLHVFLATILQTFIVTTTLIFLMRLSFSSSWLSSALVGAIFGGLAVSIIAILGYRSFSNIVANFVIGGFAGAIVFFLERFMRLAVNEEWIGGYPADSHGLFTRAAIAGLLIGAYFGLLISLPIKVFGNENLQLRGLGSGLIMFVQIAAGVVIGIGVFCWMETSFFLALTVSSFSFVMILVTMIMLNFSLLYGVTALLFGPLSLVWHGRRLIYVIWPIQKRIECWLERDWESGVANINEVVRYTSHFPSVIIVLKSMLDVSREDVLLERVASLAQTTYDINILDCNTVNMRDLFLASLADGMFYLPRRFRGKIKSFSENALCMNTPVKCASTGFLNLRWGHPEKAADAFDKIRDLPGSAGLHAVALAFSKAKGLDSIRGFTDWVDSLKWLDSSLPLWGKKNIDLLCRLRNIALEVTIAERAHVALNRIAALGRAAAGAKSFQTEFSNYSKEPESLLLYSIVSNWLDIILKAGGAAGEAVLREPIANPYGGYSGLPARDHIFVGRDDILRNIETLWTTGDVLPTIFLYGHRRMGKTSILRHLEATAPADTLIIYLDMQDTGWVEDTGELLRDVAEAIHRKATEAKLDPGKPPSEETYTTLDRARRSINKLLDRLDPQLIGRRLILAIDEFELIEEGIQKGRLDPGVLPWLRSRVQHHRWLGIIFGGLHTLDEMGGDYQKAFFSQTENVRVTYLTRKDFDRLVTQPHPDFALEYAQDLLDQIYRLTHGQPFLVQRLCWELVTRWNERFLEQGETTPRILTLADLEPVLDSDFFKNAEYYFDGVWRNVTEEERQLMTLLATREQPWPKTDLTAASREDLASVLTRLSRHDVILEIDGEIRFASELMRRWVVLQAQPGS